MSSYVIGLDYGTDSVRALLVNAETGNEVAAMVHEYKRWNQGLYCKPPKNQYRQHILDHIEGLEITIGGVLTEAHLDPQLVKAICIDTTGSSPLPVNKSGEALCLQPPWTDHPNAMMILWKDHTAVEEAEEINHLARNWGGIDYTVFEGGIYSSEWFWAKILHIIREDEGVREAAYSWVEHCDYITHMLTGNNDIHLLKRSRCAAGHKAMWHESWDGLPSKDFLKQLDPYLAQLRDHLYEETFTSDEIAGTLSSEWATKLGLTTETRIAVGTFDAHAGAVGAGAREHTLVRVMGTSTCDMIVASEDTLQDHPVSGICGQVNGSIIPGMIGLEAGQSAFGDVLAWFKSILLWPMDQMLPQISFLSDSQKDAIRKSFDEGLIEKLSFEAEHIPHTESLPVALDWINGRRTPDANQYLKGAMINLSLGTEASHLFKSLVYAICLGSKKIVDRFESEGVEIKEVIGIGGVARKSPYIMQLLANVLNKPIEVAESDQTPALGAAIYASVAAGIYPNVTSAMEIMTCGIEATYFPQEKEVVELQNYERSYDELARFIEEITEKRRSNVKI
ncbi:ribulokinase [Portibacter marinus]|uniref:ribulokinase n=1 Tax=Portibacter marinus TaxID=2898660 RepID=UPI001F25AD81|nr:ribulokinase [Portibacter marinus]